VPLTADSVEARGALESIRFERDDPESQSVRREVARRVHLTLDHLPPRYAVVLEWKYTDGLSMKEISDRMGVSAKAVESLLSRARAAFRDGFSSLGQGTWERAVEREA